MNLTYSFLFVFLFSVFFHIVSIVSSSNKSHTKSKIISYLVVPVFFSFLAYCTNGNGSVDTDYLRMVSEMKRSSEGYSSVMAWGGYQLNPLSAVWLYYIGLTGNYALLKASAALIVYGCISVICILMLSEDYNQYSVLLVWILVVSSTNFAGSVLSNVRFITAAFIVLTAAISFLCFKKNILICLIFAIIGGLTHAAVWPIVIAFFFISLGGAMSYVAAFAPLSVVFLKGVAPLLLYFPNTTFQLKIKQYLIDDNQQQFLSHNMVIYLCFVVILFSSFLIFDIIINFREMNNLPYKHPLHYHRHIYLFGGYEALLLSLLSLVFGIMPITPLYLRFAGLFPFASIILLASFFNDCFSLKRIHFYGRLYNVLILIIFVIFIIISFFAYIIFAYRFYTSSL